MPKQKKISKNKLKTPASDRRRTPGRRHAADNTKKKPILTVIAAVLILSGLIWYFAGREGNQTPAQSNVSKETTSAGTDLNFAEPQYGIEMAYVRGGTFIMGCTPEQEGDCYEHEETMHHVTLSDFYIGKYEVTQAQWRAVMGDNPSHFQGDSLPVENVSWDDAQEFIRKLNAATGETYRLPTAAEWEYAARGGRQSRGYKYSGSNDVGEIAWYEGNSENKTHPVGTKKANESGIHDLSGNVWEWVSDQYGEPGGNSQTDSEGPGEGKEASRIIRGGGWGSYARGVRVSNYYNNGPGYRYNILGFRLACNRSQ